MRWLGVAFLFALVVNAQSITGKIVDPIPLPLQNVPIGLLPVGSDWITRSTHTDANGTFRFFPVEPGDYVIVARESGFQSQVRVAEVSSTETDLGTLKAKLFAGCESPIGNCDTVGTLSWPDAPVVDLCEALKSPDRYASKLIVMVGELTTVRGWPALTAACDTALASGRLTWINAVLLPEGAVPQKSPTFPSVPDLRKKHADLVAAVRKSGGLATARVAAVYGFLDIPDGLQSVTCTDSCTRPDIRMPPASFLRVDGFEELK